MILGIPKRALFVAAVLVGVTLIYILGNGDRTPGGNGGGSTGGNDPGCQFTVSADVLNVRASPSTRANVVGKVTEEDTVDAEPTVRNGFRKLAEDGWAAEEFLAPVDGASCR
ncbi:MAG: SH3 domain-containing protein [Thermocrispum sp.]